MAPNSGGTAKWCNVDGGGNAARFLQQFAFMILQECTTILCIKWSSDNVMLNLFSALCSIGLHMREYLDNL